MNIVCGFVLLVCLSVVLASKKYRKHCVVAAVFFGGILIGDTIMELDSDVSGGVLGGSYAAAAVVICYYKLRSLIKRD